MILIGSIFTLIISNLPAPAAAPLVWDLSFEKSESSLPPELLVQWKHSLLENRTFNKVSLADLGKHFESAKTDFLKQKFSAARQKLISLENDLFSQPKLSSEIKFLIGKLEALRANLAASENNELEKGRAIQRVLFLAIKEPQLLQLLPIGFRNSLPKDVSTLFQQFEGIFWVSGWADSQKTYKKVSKISILPPEKLEKDIFARTRPILLRDKDILVRLPNQREILLPADPMYWRQTETAKTVEPTKPLWKSPWFWVVAGALAGGAGYFTYTQLQTGSQKRTR